MAFEQWCIVEVMGHQRIAGRVMEEVIGGQGFIRVDVPQTSGQAAFTKYYGPGAIYAITPTDEETAKRAAESFTARPIEAWRLAALPAPLVDDADDERYDSDDEELWENGDYYEELAREEAAETDETNRRYDPNLDDSIPF